MCKLSFAYYILFLTLVRENLIVLNKYLKSVTKPNGYYICETFPNQNDCKHKRNGYNKENKIDVNPELILLLKKLYCDIWEASKIIGNLFYLSMPAGCVFDFFAITSNSYYFFFNLFAKNAITQSMFNC